MALFLPVGSTASMIGKYGGDTLQRWRTRLILRKATKPVNHRTIRQSTTRRLTAYLSKEWENLTSQQQTDWDTYGAYPAINKAGFYAFQSNNHKLLYADHVDLVLQQDAPGQPDIPDAPTEITLTYNGGTDNWDLEWVTPDNENLYVQFWAWHQATYNDIYGAFYVFQGTAQSDSLTLAVDASNYQSGTILEGKARTINLVGETSTWTANIEESS